MTALSTRDYEQMFDLTLALLDGRESDSLMPLFGVQLNACLHGDISWTAYLRWNSRTGQPATPSCDVTCNSPLAHYYATTEDRTPRTTSEVDGHQGWTRTEVYEQFRTTTGITHQLALPLDSSPGTLRGFIIARVNDKDFSARDRAFARRVQSLLVHADRHLCHLRYWREILPVEPSRVSEERTAELDITPRELTVLALLAEGLTAAAIGRRLGISVHTAIKHLQNLYRKLNTTDRLSAVLLAQRLGLLPEAGDNRDPAASPQPPRMVRLPAQSEKYSILS